MITHRFGKHYGFAIMCVIYGKMVSHSAYLAGWNAIVAKDVWFASDLY